MNAPSTIHKDATTYKDAGVSIDAGNELVERIKPLASATRRTGTMSAIGGFGALFDLKAAGYTDPVLVSSTDGVGTKLKLAIDTSVHDTIGIDLVAMCVNDLVVQGAEPLFFLDYFATGALQVEQAAQIIGGIAKGCEQAGCALIGGETAEMPGMYKAQDYDLAGFAVGAVERDCILPRDVDEGDVILGLASSGIHSNGYSLVRHVVAQNGLALSAPAPFAPEQTLGEALLTPTRLYVKSILSAIWLNGRATPGPVKALAHITGGGLLENIPRVLPPHLAAELYTDRWNIAPVFRWLRAAGTIEWQEMYRTFNCGIGMVLVVAEKDAERVSNTLTHQGETVYRIGRMVKRHHEGVIMK